MAEHDHEVEKASTTDGLPVSPSFGPTLIAADVPQQSTPIDVRVLYLSVLSVIVGVLAALMAQVLIRFIAILTNILLFHHFTRAGMVAGINHPLIKGQYGPWVILVPIIGALIIGFLIRYGSRAVAGHGIPEAMEQVLVNQSKIPPKLTFLKPFSAAISIGTGAPYGAEGPIIATGGALGSLIGQILSVTAQERKILLAAGAAAGIAAAFNAPIASVLLAVELLLFEFRPRSLIPVGLACVAAAAFHVAVEGPKPFFHFGRAMEAPTQWALVLYLIIGALTGVGSVILSHTVYAIEHFFEHLPVHWMWHPALGAIAVGVIGYVLPQTFGSGYYNLDYLLQLDGTHAMGGVLTFVIVLGILKFASWTISLGSGTAGGTLAPVFTIGGALGAGLGFAANHLFPAAHVSYGMAALVGMVAIFAGASRALLTSVVFAVETTQMPTCILPALAGCVAAYLVSSFMMRHSIMTAKMASKGVRVPLEYHADYLDMVLVREVMTEKVTTLAADDPVEKVRTWVNSETPESSHQGFPVLDANSHLLGVLTRRDLLNPKTPPDTSVGKLLHRRPSVVYDDCSLREAVDHMVRHDVGRLPVISRAEPWKVVGIVTRRDLLSAHRQRIAEHFEATKTLRISDIRSKLVTLRNGNSHA